jgi:phage terminase small subunit
MIAGKRRKPIELRLVEGNKSKKPLPDAVPKAAGSPVKPKWLKGTAVGFWNDYAPLLPWLGRCDSEMLATWCVLAAQFAKYQAALDSARIAQLRVLAAELGMSPSARTRLGTPSHDPQKKNPYFA